ncbi:Cell envelope-related transcriptional attenuator OS=Tsukamurella paurometabola (strain ATCC 8368 /DSM / CCUG 35730 / CIP 100753 / JCM 10117 / KCTC 9821/ NBRC 16120 / NCIMB 702349 / NCTC 13040) OX=521096 GN=Tpau_1061 PE=3 SV=1 [Tsukamurella paurometabola]|uniref:Cell envelope-related transcriptional attenuator n=1 Tax=Tsukamurella paurometabola (strain ATCC 8368 / DSM 20162 / CCUG 35730 / CIP 100753 / JCM 10117 / KCTC 9821 / NBRC 16120 / NCIMB 702349 / NCTC 13040) TaxID=521096 RepID=D5UVA3_TSUPD|nr:LCP family protein [Tsukamurella paurometabola]ADG77693.1 cell envelope-related transcriptional attenuator [Tsukamurella paurometabola DSM 20162]SUP28333.1 Membrane-bound protein lytR [Tsukamurella paurometabola]
MSDSPGPRGARHSRGGDKPPRRRRSVRAENEGADANGTTGASGSRRVPGAADLSDAARARIHRTGKTAIVLLAAVVLIATGVAWTQFYQLGGDIARTGGLDSQPDGATDILLVGTDSRTDAKGNPLTEKELARLNAGVDDGTLNTDTIILIRIPNNGKSATAISIPRDAYVAIPDQGKGKINSAFAGAANVTRDKLLTEGKSEKDAIQAGNEEGRKALRETVANLTGVSVDNYAEIGLVGFSRLTDAVGGVEVCLKRPVNDSYSGARFRAGRQTLKGPQALSFVRQRHGLPRGDLDRITRQQVFMASLANKILSAGTLTNPSKVNQLQNAVTTSVTLDANWDVMNFAKELANLSAGSVKFATVPVVRDDGWSDDGQQSVVVVDPKQVQAYVRSLLGDKPGATSAKPTTSSAPAVPSVNRAATTVDVVNGGSTPGLASSVSSFLTGEKFQQGTTGNASNSESSASGKSAVLASSANDQPAKAVAALLGGLPVIASSSVQQGRVKVLLKDGYKGPGSSSDTEGTAASTTTSIPPGMTEAMDPSEAARVSSLLNRPGYTASQDGGVPCVD